MGERRVGVRERSGRGGGKRGVWRGGWRVESEEGRGDMLASKDYWVTPRWTEEIKIGHLER